jgi:hypothetical protein
MVVALSHIPVRRQRGWAYRGLGRADLTRKPRKAMLRSFDPTLREAYVQFPHTTLFKS